MRKTIIQDERTADLRIFYPLRWGEEDHQRTGHESAQRLHLHHQQGSLNLQQVLPMDKPYLEDLHLGLNVLARGELSSGLDLSTTLLGSS